MNRKLWLQTAACSTLALSTLAAATVAASAQQPASAPVSISTLRVATDSSDGAARWLPVNTVRPSVRSLSFGSSALGAAPRHLKATFAFAGSATTLSPSVSAHFGHDYTFGPIDCAGGGATQTCSLDVTFTPSLPGAREDALFLSDGTKRLATLLLHGTGQSPLALLQPDRDSYPGRATSNIQGVVDDNGTLFLLDRTSGTVISTTSAGVSNRLAIQGLDSARSLQIDGAGVLYLLPSDDRQSIVTFDTVLGTQGSLALPVAARLVDTIALDPTGDIFAFSSQTQRLFRIDSEGAVTSTPSTEPLAATLSGMVVAPNGDLLTGGSSLRIITPTGAQREIAAANSLNNPHADSFTPLSVDAAGTLYARTGSSLIQLSGPDYATVASLPFSDAVGSDGALYLGTAHGYSRADRGATSIDFGDVASGTSSDARFATLLNAGNLPLTLSNLQLSGDDFALSSAPADSCSAGSTLAPGASCQIGAALLSSHTATSRGTLIFISNSLNNASTTQAVGLIAHAAVPSQAVLTPTALPFPSTVVSTLNPTPLVTVLSNPGTAALNITSIAITGAGTGSYALTQTCGTSLAAGASCNISVSFKPLSLGAQPALVSVVDDAGGTVGSNQTATLTGIGIAAPAPVIAFLPSTLNFGLTGTTPAAQPTAVIIGTSSAPQTINIFNNGNAIANISSLTLTTIGVSLQYNFTTTCGTTLAIGANCAVTIIFTPTTGGATPATTLSIADNAAGSPQSAAITGVGTGGNYNVTTPTTTITIPSSGGSASVVLTATPAPAPFPSPVSFVSLGVPGAGTFSFSPAVIYPMTTPATTTFTVTLPPYHPSTLAQLNQSLPGRHPYLPVMAVMVSGLCFSLRRRKSLRQARLLQMLLLAMLGLGITSMSGCYGGFTVGGGVPPGTYAITISAQSANGVDNSVVFPTQHFINVNLIVQ